jgi:hypothetical protein
MAKVSQVYASPWLRAEDLQGRTIKVTIGRAGVDLIPQNDGSKQERIIVDFLGKQKRLILNKTQAAALAGIAGDDTDQWSGIEVYLAPQPTNNGKLTIGLLPVPTTNEDGNNHF